MVNPEQPQPKTARDRREVRARERRELREAARELGDEMTRREYDRVAEQLDDMLSDEHLAELTEERQVGRDRGAAVALAVLAVIEIAIVSSLASYPTIAAQLHLLAHPGIWPYIAGVACFVPLAFRRGHPIVALAATSVLAGVYLAMPWPPSIVILAPMTALFTVAERYGGRRAIPVGIVLGAIVLGVSAMAVSVTYTVAQLVAILALLGLAAALGHGARQRRDLFEEVREKRREEALRREEQQLRRVEEERLRIARDVHDIMAHSLTLMTLQADAGVTSASDAEKSAAAFTVIGDTGRATLRDLRSMLSVLTAGEENGSPREPVADLSQLGELVRSVGETGLDIDLEASGDLSRVPSAVAVSAYRIVQESLTNVVRHSHARHATVRVDVGDVALELLISDNGVGTAPPADHMGRGLAGMRERVEVLGGTISAGPVETGGFAVHATLPLTGS